VSAIPGVAEAAATTWIPLTGDHDASTLGVEDRPPPPNTVPPVHPLIYATSNFLATMGIPILSGRALGPQDPAHPLLEAVVSRAFARRYWGDSSALGRRVRPALVTFAGPWYTVVGVAGDVHFRGLEQPADEAVYFPAMLVRKDSLIVPPGLSLVVRSRNGSSPTAITPEVRQAVRSIDPGLPIYGEQSMASVVHAASARTRFLVVVLALASAMALVLGAVGLYGVMAYGVSLRQREIGVRMALGARPSDVGRMISRQGLMLTGIGVVIGLAGAIAITRFLRGLLYDVSPTDPLTLVATCLVLFVVALVASWLPARRAAAVDPADALRE
jgi:predicted permease